ncbi:MAG: Fic family protein [Parcubacteria group bacterium GW2011_GWB1_43_8]|nr:MAG: Fic family protein [Parcubacteria group bacterium GW2011_GWB1_43_8]
MIQLRHMEKFTKREFNILEFIRKNKKAGNAEIANYLASISAGTSRITIIRSINALIKAGLVERKGEGRSVYYEEKSASPLLAYFDIEEYFKKSPDERSLALERFNFGIFDNLGGIFSKGELDELKNLNDNYEKRIKNLTPAIIKKEFERLTVELSWKSSQIEGNTYSLIDTEILIKENKEAEGHKKEEAIMILNHKKALDYIINNRNEFKNLTLRKIEDIHGLIVDGLSVAKGLRKKPVGITGTKYKPLDNEYQIREMMEKTVEVANKKLADPFSKAIFTMLMISYIQPFEDGNKRTSRLLGNAILLAGNACPLSYRSVNEADYKKAVILFYEQNSARFFKELFIEQFKFAVSNYFLA